MGNRGILHDENKRIIRASRNTMWLICRLEFKGRKRPLMSPGTYTELFFLDEAVALAAGHRPCGECRRAQYRAFIEAVNDGVETRLDGPRDLDRRLNDSRRAPRTTAPLADLPNGVFVSLDDDEFWLVWDGSLHRWSPEGYFDAVAIADAGIETVAVVDAATDGRGTAPRVFARGASLSPTRDSAIATCSGYSEPVPVTSQGSTRDATEQPMRHTDSSTAGRDQAASARQPSPPRRGLPRHGAGARCRSDGHEPRQRAELQEQRRGHACGQSANDEVGSAYQLLRLSLPARLRSCQPNCSATQSISCDDSRASTPRSASTSRCISGRYRVPRPDRRPVNTTSGQDVRSATWHTPVSATSTSHSFRRRVGSALVCRRNISAGRPLVPIVVLPVATRCGSIARRKVSRCSARPAMASCASRSSRSVNSSPSSRSGSGLSA